MNKNITDVYDLEQAMLTCWNVVDDIKLLYENVLDNPDMTIDEISNVLLGLSAIYSIKHQKAFDIFEDVFRQHNEKEINNDTD